MAALAPGVDLFLTVARGEFARLDVRAVQQDPRLQTALAVRLSRLWTTGSPADQQTLLGEILPYFPRALGSSRPTETLRRILQLPREEDIARALRVRSEQYRIYRADPGEDIYPTGGWLGRYLSYARANEVPLGYHWWTGLTILSAACRRNFYLDIGISYLWPATFTVLSGKKGAKKSVAMEVGEDLLSRLNRQLEQIDPSLRRSYGVHMFPEDTTKAGLIQELVQQNTVYAQHDPETGVVEMPGADPTVGDATGIIFCDELSNLLGKDTHEAGQKIPFFVSVAYRDRYIKATKTDQREEINNLGLSLLACSAPEWFQNTIHSDALAGGFVDRLNIVYRKPTGRAIPQTQIPPLDPVEAENLAEWLQRVCRPPARGRCVLELRKDAADFFNAWYTEERLQAVRDGDDGRFRSLERYSNSVLRISMVLAISAEEEPWISLERVEQAMEVLKYEETWLDEFWNRATERSDAKFYDWIKNYVANQGVPLKGSAIKARFKKQIGHAKEVQPYLETLVEAKELVLWPGGYYALPYWRQDDPRFRVLGL